VKLLPKLSSLPPNILCILHSLNWHGKGVSHNCTNLALC